MNMLEMKREGKIGKKKDQKKEKNKNTEGKRGVQNERKECIHGGKRFL